MSLTRRWQECLEASRSQGRYRRLTPPQGLDFSSNDYLGYGRLTPPSSSPLSQSGMASRLLRGHHALWDEVESKLAAWHGAEAALIMTSGYVANEGLLSTIIDPGDWVASDQANHASIIDGLRLAKADRFVFHHNDLNHLEAGLRAAQERRSSRRQLFIVVESLYGMEGDVAPLHEMSALAERFQAQLVVDEAHATGCFGATGAGLIDELGLRQRVLVSVHTGGKALAVPGAYVVGSRLLKELLVNRCRHLIFTTALPPQVAAWWLEALSCVQQDGAARSRLYANAGRFRGALAEAGVNAGGSHYVAPIIIGEDTQAVRAATSLQNVGYDIRAIRPPTVPEGTARLRVSIHADHAPDTLVAAARAIAQALR